MTALLLSVRSNRSKLSGLAAYYAKSFVSCGEVGDMINSSLGRWMFSREPSCSERTRLWRVYGIPFYNVLNLCKNRKTITGNQFSFQAAIALEKKKARDRGRANDSYTHNATSQRCTQALGLEVPPRRGHSTLCFFFFHFLKDRLDDTDVRLLVNRACTTRSHGLSAIRTSENDARRILNRVLAGTKGRGERDAL